jgi:hypothetical protein
VLSGRGCGESGVTLSPTVLQIDTTIGIPKKRQFVRVCLVSPDLEIVPFNHRLSTLERAVKERVYTVKDASPVGYGPPPKPKPGYFESKMGDFAFAIGKHLPKTAPWTHEQFVDSYQGRKKDVYQRALTEIASGCFDVEGDARVSVFIKNEKTDRTTKQDPVPRVISPRSPRYNLRVGRYLKKIEHKVFKSIGKLFGHATVMKGYDVHQSAAILREKWDKLVDPVAVGLDASRFDQHVSQQALQFEHKICVSCFARKKDKDKLRKLLSHQLRNQCVGYTPDGKLKYTTDGTRMSGDMNTSLGNCILMCGMIWQYLFDKSIKAHLANNGDDCVVFMERKDLASFSNGLDYWFRQLGFNMVVEAPVFDFGEIEFCQTKPVFDGQNWVMCRNPRTAIAKDSVMLSAYQSVGKFLGWLDAVGTGGLAMTGGLPVFQSFYSMYVRSGLKRKIPDNLLSWNMQQHLKHGVCRYQRVVTPESRSSFYTSFGYTPDEQLELERYYDEMFISPKLGDGTFQPRLVFPDL